MRQERTIRRGSPWRRRILIAVLGLVLAGVAAVAVIYSLATYTPPAPPPPAMPPQQAEQAMKQVAQEVERVQEASKAKVRAPYKVHVRSDEVNAYMAAHPVSPDGLPAGIERVRDVRVSFEGGQMTGSAYVTFQGREVYITVTGRLLPDGAGGVIFVADDMRLGKLPMPASLRDEVTRRLQAEVSKRVAEMGLAVDSVEATNGQVTIGGTAGGRQ